jgi:tetratricopeptide (TPR) repeat protein
MIGKYIRLCADNLELAFNVQRKLDPNLRDNISSNCWNSKNKQLIDQAGQTFGRLGELQKSAKFLEKSTQLDPMSPNSLLSLAITYHIDRKIKKEKPIILRLLKLIPEDPQVLRLGIQVAGLLKDKKMSQNILYLMSLHNKEALPLAKKFIDNAFKIN